MKRSEENWAERAVRLTDVAGLERKALHELVSGTTVAVLRNLKLDMRFLLNINPAKWQASAKYIQMKKEITTLTVVNDSAERAMALMTTFNHSLTKNEDEKQRVLQVAEDNRRRISDANKKTIVKAFSKRLI
jgi:hypothetical protein